MKRAQQRRTQGGFDIAFSEFRDAVIASQEARYESAKAMPYSQSIGRLLTEYFTSNYDISQRGSLGDASIVATGEIKQPSIWQSTRLKAKESEQ